MRVYVDFESRSQVDIWESGAWVYAESPTTEILCLCYAIDDGPVITLTRANMAAGMKDINALIQAGAEFHAHNAYFERCMWRHKLTPIYGALPVPIKQWRCTAAKASTHALPRALEHCAEALRCTHKKDAAGNKVMRLIAKSTGPIDQEKLDRLYQYCAKDVEVEREIDKRLVDLSPKEQVVWYLDQFINDTGVAVDVEAIQKAIVVIEEETKRLTDELYTLTGGEVTAGTQRDAIKRYLEAQGCALPDLTKKTIVGALKEASGDNLRVLQLRQQLSLTSNAKYKALLAAVSPDGRVRDMLIYHGASTGRWTGKLFQLQNLPRPTDESTNYNTAIRLLKAGGLAMMYDNVLSVLSGCIRGMFIPTRGYEMGITDFAAIEARVVMWLAGETGGLSAFEAQDADTSVPDIYVMMARAIYGKPDLVKKNKIERQLGKQAILACGFGMGVDKFKQTCKNYHIDVTDALAERSVYTYRRTFKKVVNFWCAMESAAKKCVSTGKPQSVGLIGWRMDGEFLRMVLPSGRALSYHRPQVRADDTLTFMAVNNTTKKYEVERTWGGTLVENATQAVARDLMVEAMLRMVNRGFRILFTVHDEIVAEAPTGTKTENDVLEIVRTKPTWAAGLPVNAECEKVSRYKK